MKLNDPSILRDSCYINGEWCGDPAIPVTNPASGETLASVPRFGKEEAEIAVAAAELIGRNEPREISLVTFHSPDLLLPIWWQDDSFCLAATR